jgi:hypothetical protein
MGSMFYFVGYLLIISFTTKKIPNITMYVQYKHGIDSIYLMLLNHDIMIFEKDLKTEGQVMDKESARVPQALLIWERIMPYNHVSL